MLKIPYGLADFHGLRVDQCFYRDRTQYIEQLETYGTRYTMFLRPRRFGKSLFLSMLEQYYDVEKAAEFQMLFGDLYIGKQPTPLANQFLILKFDFSGIETNDITKTHEAFLLKTKDGFSGLISAYSDLFTDEQEQLILNQPLASSMAIEFFRAYRKNKVQRSIYVLIDEYDQFTNELLSFHFHDFKAIVSENGYVRKFYEVLKTEARNGTIGRIFITGVAPVTIDSMTSGFNIATDLSLQPRFHNMMGFTEAEVLALLNDLSIPANALEGVLETLRNWYDGYCFNLKTVQHLYNPEMVLYFARYYQSECDYPLKMLTGNIATDYKKIANIFKIGNNEDLALKQLNYLLENGEIRSYLTDKFNVELAFGITEIWSMLFYTGMLTVKAIFGNNWAFQMPNYVIKNLYYDYFAALHMGRTYGRFRHEIRDAIEKLLDFGDITDFVRLVGEVLKEHSNRDKVADGEKHLKTLMIGLLVPYESYWIRSEPESKGKYVDIFLERIPQVFIKHEIVLELKYIKKEDRLKWVDYQGNIVDPPPSAKSSVAMPAKKGRKPKVQPAPVLVPVTPTNPPVKTLLDYVSENGAVQLAGYMELPYYQRPNLLGFCLVFVGNECHKILPYQP